MIVKEANTETEYYLTEQKSQFKKFIEDNENDVYNYGLLFAQTARYEVFFGKDILDFSRSQIISMFEDLGATASTFEKRNRYLERYFEYFGRRFYELSFDDLDVYANVRRCNIRDVEEFKHIINNAFKPDDMQTLDIVRKACLILVYFGVSKSDIPELLKSDFDETTKTLNVNTIKVVRHIPPDFIPTLRECRDIKTYNSVHPKLGIETRNLQDNQYLIRSDAQRTNDEKCSIVFIDKIFSGDTFNVVDKNLTPTRVFESGMYYWLYRQEETEFDSTKFRNLIETYLNKPIKQYQHWFLNYCAWKRAFGL